MSWIFDFLFFIFNLIYLCIIGDMGHQLNREEEKEKVSQKCIEKKKRPHGGIVFFPENRYTTLSSFSHSKLWITITCPWSWLWNLRSDCLSCSGLAGKGEALFVHKIVLLIINLLTSFLDYSFLFLLNLNSFKPMWSWLSCTVDDTRSVK